MFGGPCCVCQSRLASGVDAARPDAGSRSHPALRIDTGTRGYSALCIDTRGHSARPGIDIRLNAAWSIGGRTVAFYGNPLLFHKVARCISGGTGASLYATLCVHHLSRRRRLLRQRGRACKCGQGADNGKISDHWTFSLEICPPATTRGEAKVSRDRPVQRTGTLESPSRTGSRVEH
jgi:hypothetical protein